MSSELYASVFPASSCPRCFETGIWLSPRNEVNICPQIQLGLPHDEPNQASLIIRKAANRMLQQKKFIHAFEFELARILTHYDSQKPCSREILFDFFFADTNLDFRSKLRKFHELIESLRKVWLLPVGSRKSEPCGYWIITNLNDYKAWIDRAKSAPITQLSTIHANARFNYPEYAEQLELEFWQDVEPTEVQI